MQVLRMENSLFQGKIGGTMNEDKEIDIEYNAEEDVEDDEVKDD